MSCDYYTEKSVVIEYVSKDSKICKIVKTTKIERKFLDRDRYQPNTEKYIQKLEKKLNGNPVKMIYENNEWTKETFQHRYHDKFKKMFPDIKTFIKIYKRTCRVAF